MRCLRAVMSNDFVILGAGRQGIATAYDLARFGEAKEIILADNNISAAQSASKKINQLVDKSITRPLQLDANDADSIISNLPGVSSIISAVPYHLNLNITRAAIKLGANMCDLGGHTQTALKQHELDIAAKESDATIVPDCGMGPGMNISLAVYAMSLLDIPKEVYIWDGGLPQNPQPPWNYALTFNIKGLTNEYSGNAYFLRDGKIIKVPCFEDYEMLNFPPPLNELEAFVTSGGLSTMPWTFEGKLHRLENKTLRYPGHHAQFNTILELGLMDEIPIKVGDALVTPRDVLHNLLEPKISKPDIRDIAVIRVKCTGEKNGEKADATVELVDMYDEKTGFTAMQRLTGWHASIVAILSAQNRIPKGVVSVERISGGLIVEEMKQRDFRIKESMDYIE
jgi:lysine 6-dehydrogenase